jgi:hypothetical protein
MDGPASRNFDWQFEDLNLEIQAGTVQKASWIYFLIQNLALPSRFETF